MTHSDPTVGAWAQMFALTMLLEFLVAGSLLRSAEPRLPRRLLLIAFATLATHPAVWFIIPKVGLSYGATVVAAESWAIVVEAVFYAIVAPRVHGLSAVGVSALANAASYAGGFAMSVAAASGHGV
ncbi:MAG: hypothetical protein NVS3B20_10450 [Polyangiales bacterium]